MTAILWFVLGFAFHGAISVFRRAGTGVRIMKSAEIRSLELLAQSASMFYQAQGMIELSSEKIGDSESVKLIKNEIDHEYKLWQKKTIEVMKHSMDPDFRGFREWDSWSEAMAYLASVKAENRLFIIAKSGNDDNKRRQK